MSSRIYTYMYQIYYMYLNIFYKLPTSGIYVKYSEYTPFDCSEICVCADCCTNK